MDNDEIQRILDDLDVQLASARIDLGTYQTLVSKWTLRMQHGSIPAAPAPSIESAPAVAAAKIACPNCGAPLPEAHASNGYYVCEFCSHTFTVERAQQETEKLKKELQGWLSQLVAGTGTVVGSATVDASSRAFIFREKLYPSLEVEFNRSLEWLEGFREYPLFQVASAAGFASHSLEENPLRSGHQQLIAVRNLSSKLGAPAMREFVMVEDDQRKLGRMQVKVDELIFTANILEQTGLLTADGYATARQNIAALKDLYSSGVELAAAGPEKEFLRASLVRLDATGVVLDILGRLCRSVSGDVPGSALATELEGAARRYEEALKLADNSGYTPMEIVPWRHGVDKELALISLQSELLKSHERVCANRPGSFFTFQESVLDFARQSRIPLAGPEALAILVDSLASCVEAKRGTLPLARLADWSWMDPAVEGQRRKSMVKFMGVTEQVEAIEQFWQPFWLATLAYSQSEGAIFKSGTAKNALLLLDATASGQAIASVIEEGSAFHGQLDSAVRTEWVDSRACVPAIVGEPAARKALDAFVRSNQALRNAKVTMRALVYLPACSAKYQSKEGRRETVLSVIGQINTDTGMLRQSANQFIRRFAE